MFVDRAAATGLDFAHFNGMSGELYFVEMNGAGAALFDYDRDDDLDLYLVQGTTLGTGKSIADATLPPRDRLYRNEGDGTFTGPRTVTPSCSTTSPAFVTSQLPPVSAARSTITELGRMPFIWSFVTRMGALRPGMAAVVMTTSAPLMYLASSSCWRLSPCCWG